MSVNERGFTLIEILVSLAIFAVVVIGALGVLGAAGSSGFLEGFPTGFAATRTARDTTAAAVYLQAFHEYAAGWTGAVLTAGRYCDGADCTSTSPIVSTPISSSGLTGSPTPPGPPAQPYQLDWRRLDVTVDRYYPCLDLAAIPQPVFKRYSMASGADCTIVTDRESLVRIHSTLTWRFRAVTGAVASDGKCAPGTRYCVEVDRVLP